MVEQYSSSSGTLPSARLQALGHSPGMARQGTVTTPSPPVSAVLGLALCASLLPSPRSPRACVMT